MVAYPLSTDITASQGPAGSISGSWFVTLASGSTIVGDSQNPLNITGSVSILGAQLAVTGALPVTGSITIENPYARTMGAAVQEGVVPGADNAGHVFAYGSTSGQTIVTVRATAYVQPLSSSNFEVVSSAPSDASGSNGTRVLRVTYFRSDGTGPYTSDIHLSGTLPSYIGDPDAQFIERLETLEVGSNGSNAGTITIRGQGNGPVAGTVAIGDGMTFWGHHYVAINRQCFITGIYGCSTGNSCRLWIRDQDPLFSTSFLKQSSQFYRVQAVVPTMLHEMQTPVKISGFRRLDQVVRPDSNTAMSIFCGFSYYEI